MVSSGNNNNNELNKDLNKGPYIKYVGGGAGGPRNIFLCSIFVILFFKLRWLQYKISKLAIKDI